MTEFLKLKKSNEYLKYDKSRPVFAGNAFLPHRAFVSVSTCDGSSLTPLVSKGELVHDGQVIAKSSNPKYTDIHAPIPGRIGNIKEFESTSGEKLVTIPIKLEGGFRLLGKKKPHYTWKNTSKYELVKIIESMGVINTSSDNISFATQIRKSIKNMVTHLNVCLFDEDPSCGINSFLIEDFFKQIIEGIGIVSYILNVNKVSIFHKLDSIKVDKFNDEIKLICPNVDIEFIHSNNTYPFHRRDLQYSNQDFLLTPLTALYVDEAVTNDTPLISTYVLLTGKGLKEEKVLRVRIGTPIGNLLEECGGLAFHPDYIVINGLIKGYTVKNLDMPVDKTVKSIHIVSNRIFKPNEIRSCENCGRCISVCPKGLNPGRLLKMIAKGRYSKEIIQQISICGSCSTCTCACPARIEITSIIASSKKKLNLKSEY